MVVCMRMLKQRSLLFGCILAGLLVLLPVAFEASAAGVRIYIDTHARTLQVLEGDRVIATFNGIAIGRFGKTYYKMRGDNKTPLGNFRIGWIGKQSRYHRFLGLTYPDMDAADRALVDGRIDEEQWQQIRRAAQAGKTPPQDTPLGGLIGIHGVGSGDLEVHREYNWTNGCIALTNAQIDLLAEWAKVGTPVEIR
jgi:lipoprotein-anchoring transpeptidase ErfK/SrfK